MYIEMALIAIFFLCRTNLCQNKQHLSKELEKTPFSFCLIRGRIRSKGIISGGEEGGLYT